MPGLLGYDGKPIRDDVSTEQVLQTLIRATGNIENFLQESQQQMVMLEIKVNFLITKLKALASVDDVALNEEWRVFSTNEFRKITEMSKTPTGPLMPESVVNQSALDL